MHMGGDGPDLAGLNVAQGIVFWYEIVMLDNC